MARLLLFNKPFQVLSQFTDTEGRNTLADYISEPGVYPAGRLDYDSEGLLLLCDDGALQARIADPKHKLKKHYWVQVEGEFSNEAALQLSGGVTLKDGPTKPAQVRKINAPEVWKRFPPIRERAKQTTSWIEVVIAEGKNRQVRRMTAHVGFPTLRLIRHQIGNWSLNNLAPGEFQTQQVHLPKIANKPNTRPPRKRYGK
jgi:23S rRNA pseudouridine2457 synthase